MTVGESLSHARRDQLKPFLSTHPKTMGISHNPLLLYDLYPHKDNINFHRSPCQFISVSFDAVVIETCTQKMSNNSNDPHRQSIKYMKQIVVLRDVSRLLYCLICFNELKLTDTKGCFIIVS
jgi:hypothetical protein